MNQIPMPGDRHPSLPDFDPDLVNLEVLKVPIPTRGGMAVTTMHRRKYWAPAPYIGRPFIYTWAGFITNDNTGRAIVGRAHIAYPPPDPCNPATYLTDTADDSEW